MSQHASNVAAAVASHREYFGEPTDSAQRVEYRESKECNWRVIENAVVHGEFVSFTRKGNERTRETRRHVFCNADQITDRVFAHIRIGGSCGPIYSIAEITRKGDRRQLHLVRYQISEVARPGHREQQYRRR